MKSCTLIQEEYLAALTSLMQQPGSPEVKKPTGDSDFTYSIVLDVKSSV